MKDAFSTVLKRHVADCIIRFQRFDEAGAPCIPYISVWRENEKKIWYEFMGRQMILLLKCRATEVAEAFRSSILESRKYKHPQTAGHTDYETLHPEQLRGDRLGLREAVEKDRFLEAVYKSRLSKGKIIWLKDQAVIEKFSADDVCICLGCLTLITKEMEIEEHLKRTRKALEKSEKKFREQAVHDDLTGLYNTRYLYKTLSRLISGNQAGSGLFSLIFMDIDDFKTVVDTHGHLNASRAIQEVAATVQKAVAEPAFCVAYGGDEFVIVLPEMAKKAAVEIADNIRIRIGKTPYLTGVGLRVFITSSFGVSTFPDDAAGLTEILALADRAMFKVKKQGKNSVGDMTAL